MMIGVVVLIRGVSEGERKNGDDKERVVIRSSSLPACLPAAWRRR